VKSKKKKDLFKFLIIHEVGILIRGVPLVTKKFYENHEEDLKFILRSGVFTGLLHCIEEAMSPIEYIEGNKYLFVFYRSFINSSDTGLNEPIIAYSVIDKTGITKIEKILEKKIKPLLKILLNQFIEENSGKDFCEITQFSYYTEIIEEIFSSDYTLL